jgi:hypothetical protein
LNVTDCCDVDVYNAKVSSAISGRARMQTKSMQPLVLINYKINKAKSKPSNKGRDHFNRRRLAITFAGRSLKGG